MKPALIGLAGRKGAGKTTLADYLSWTHGFYHIAISEPIKGMLDELQNWVSRDTRSWSHDCKDTPCSELYGLTPRYLLQTLGAEWGRNTIHPNLWIDIAMRDAEWFLQQDDTVLPGGVVISDVRFPDEAAAIRARGGLVYWVGADPSVNDDAHSSETCLSPKDADHVLENPPGDPKEFCKRSADVILKAMQR